MADDKNVIGKVQAQLLATPSRALSTQQLARRLGEKQGDLRAKLVEMEQAGQLVRAPRCGSYSQNRGDDLWRLPEIRSGRRAKVTSSPTSGGQSRIFAASDRRQ